MWPTPKRFIECEKWRKEFGVDELLRSFSYDEKPKVSEFYPQYYHKTDKVSTPCFFFFLEELDTCFCGC